MNRHRATHLPSERKLWILSILSALFISALVVCNLIASKFITLDLGVTTFEISAGVLPYPITFLITDLLSEFYGKRITQRVVLSGFVALIFTMGVLYMGGAFPALDNSPVSDAAYTQVFGNSPRVIMASMVAYLLAQLVDVRLYHFWKRLTNGRMLWLRNNFSTVLSQLVDTTLVVGILFIGDASWTFIGGLIIHGWLFKVIAAALDTPLMYAGVAVFRKIGIEPAPADA